MSGNFRELLSMHTDNVDRPRPLPIGHYYAELTGYSFDQSKQKQTPYVRFNFRTQEAYTDVNPTELEGMDITKKEVSKDFYLTPTSLYRLSDFLDAVLGKQAARSFDERIPEVRSARVLIQITQRKSQNGDEVYNDVGTVVAA
jgi:hypothetical protein